MPQSLRHRSNFIRADARRHALLLIFTWLAVASSRAQALELTTVAGTVDGQVVTVADASRAAGNDVATATWRGMDAIVRTAVRGLCTDRIQNLLAEADGLDPISWRARLWQNTEPSPDEVAAYAQRHIHPGTDTESPETPELTDLTDDGHELHVKAYREKLARTAERMLNEDLVWNIPSPPDTPTGELALTSPVATCVGRPISADDVRRYAAVPLYDRESQLVSVLCAQFQTDPPAPLILDRVAARAGRTPDQLMAEIEGDASDIPAADVEREALDRFGRTDEAALANARKALDAQRRADRRRAWTEKVRRETKARCDLQAPEPPRSEVRSHGITAGLPSGLPVYYFGNFDCTDCVAGWLTLRQVLATRDKTARVEFRHHFPETDGSLFTRALEAECAAAQNRFWQYGDRRASGAPHPPPGAALQLEGIDSTALASCMVDPRTAVTILEDTAEALRLGFREAVPSWVVGNRVRRGATPQADIDRDIDEQLARKNAGKDLGEGVQEGVGVAPAKKP